MAVSTDKASVVRAMAKFLQQPADKLGDQQALTDLVADSFVLVEMVIHLQEEFGVHFGQEELKGVRTVGDLTTLISSLAKPRRRTRHEGPPAGV